MGPQNPGDDESTLSDALLRALMAVGQVDVLVGLPTLNNAATVVNVVRAPAGGVSGRQICPTGNAPATASMRSQ